MFRILSNQRVRVLHMDLHLSESESVGPRTAHLVCDYAELQDMCNVSNITLTSFRVLHVYLQVPVGHYFHFLPNRCHRFIELTESLSLFY